MPHKENYAIFDDVISGFSGAKKTVVKSQNSATKKTTSFQMTNLSDMANMFSNTDEDSSNVSTKSFGNKSLSDEGSFQTNTKEKRLRAISSFCTQPGFDFMFETKEREEATKIDSLFVESNNTDPCGTGFFPESLPMSKDPFFWFFGETTTPYHSKFNVKDETTFTLPTPFIQDECCERISDTVEQLSFLDGSWHFTVAPITPTTSNKICWSEAIYASQIAKIVPTYGRVELLPASRHSGSAQFNQRGLGFRMHHGFMLTPPGIADYLNKLSQLARSIEETNKMLIIHKLTSMADQMMMHDLCSNRFEGKSMKEALIGEVDSWDQIKKNPDALTIFETQINEKQKQMGADVSDTWIVPPQFTAFVSTMKTAQTDQKRVGETAAARLFNDGPDSFIRFGTGTIRVSRLMNVDQQQTIDPLKYPESIGEMWALELPDSCDVSKYDTCDLNARIYDEEKNKFVDLTLEKVWENINRFNPDGTIKSYKSSPLTNTFSTEELSNDPFYMLGANQPIAQKFFVNLPDSKLRASSRMLIGRTIKNALVRGQVPNISEGQELLTTVRSEVQKMEKYGMTAAVTYWNAIGVKGPTKAKSSARPSGSNKPIFDIEEYTASQTTGMQVGLKADIAPPAGSLGLPPGMQSWAGMKWIDEVSRLTATKLFSNVDAKIIENIRKFVVMFEATTSKLKTMFPGSEALNARNAASWWQFPSAESVLFQNFISKHRVPIWTLTAAASGSKDKTALFAPTKTIGALVNSLDVEYKANVVAITAAKAALGTRTKVIAEVVDITGKTVPSSPAFAGKIGLTPDPSGLKADNYELYRVPIWISSVIKLLISKISGDKIAEKLAALEAVVTKNFSTIDAKLYDGSFNMGELLKDIRGLFSKKAGDLAFDGTYDEFRATSEDISNKLVEAGAGVAIGATDISVKDPVRTTLLSWPKFIEDLAKAVEAGEKIDYSLSDPDLPDTLIDTARILKEIDLQERKDNARSPAFINSELETVKPNVAHNDFARVMRSFILANTHHGEDSESQGGSSMAVDEHEADERDNKHIGAEIDDYDVDQEEDFTSSSKSKKSAGDLRTATATSSAPALSRAALDSGFVYHNANAAYLLDKTARDNFTALAEIDDGTWDYVFANVFNYSRVLNSQIKNFMTHHILFPYKPLTLRPHMEYLVFRIIKLKAGARTIRMYQKKGRATAGDDAETDEHFVKYIYEGNPVVIRPKNVCVLKNVFVDGYVRGAGTNWINVDEYAPRARNFGGGDLIATVIGRDEPTPEVLNISGSNNDLQEVYQLADSKTLQISSAPWLVTSLGLVRGKKSHSHTEKFTYANECTSVNQVCWLGVRKNRVNGEWKITEAGNGHWGVQTTYDLCHNARMGKEPYNYLVNRA